MITVVGKTFLLSGKNYSYVISVDNENYPQCLYYGKKISGTDVGFLVKSRKKETDLDNINRDAFSGTKPLECGGFGKGDYRSATVIVKRADGAAMSTFKYFSHRIVKGAVKLDGLPCVRKADETLIITLKDSCSNTETDLVYTVADRSDVLVRNAVIRNIGKESADIVKAYSFCTQLPYGGKTYSALRLAGAWSSERQTVITPLAEGMLKIESARGYSSHQMNPFLAIFESDCTEEKGDCYGFNLLYSGNFALCAEVTGDKNVRVQGGINEYMFGWRLDGGASFVTPQAALCYSADGLGGMSRAYHDFFREYIINPDCVYKRRPIVVNNWEATYFDFDAEKLFAITDEAAKLGIDTFVLDDGWFGERNSDSGGLGDWFANEKKLKGGLKAVAERCRKNGIKFGLWFEPEMVSENSDLYRLHPEYAAVKADVPPSRERNQLVLDLSKKEVVDYVFNAVGRILKENGISYVKWDKNRDMTEFYSNSLPAERQGEFAHRYILGFYDLAERLTAAFPEVLFEGCAAGGGRFDGGALYYFPQIWTSDNTDAFERAKIQYGTSLCYPLGSMSCHVSVCPNHQTGRTTPFETRGVIASLGATGYELDLTKLSEAEKTQVKAQIKNYRQIGGLILNGDLYRLSDPFDTNCFCEMIVAKDKKRAYVAGEIFRGRSYGSDRILKLRGLDENKNYFIKELNLTASGAALMYAGAVLPHLTDCGAWVWHVEEAG